MNKFDLITHKFRGLNFMCENRAATMREFIADRPDINNILEIGTHHGKSAAYMGAILEELNRPGRVTTIDKSNALNKSPTVFELLNEVNVTNVDVILAHRTYIIELTKLIEQDPMPQFDFCYFDGGHGWLHTGFGFVLVDFLLKPGGWIIFDDMDWNLDYWINSDQFRPDEFSSVCDYERNLFSVKRTYDLLTEKLGYSKEEFNEEWQWGIARKSNNV